MRSSPPIILLNPINNFRMIKVRFIVGVFVGFILLLLSCSEDDNQQYTVGNDFVDPTTTIISTDTLTIKAETFKLDSIVTSGSNRILLGNISDDNFGQLTAQSFFQLQNDYFSIEDNTQYDSIGLILRYDNYYFGDTTKIQTYNVYRILETVTSDDDNFYNTSTLDNSSNPNYNYTALGKVSFYPKPNTENDSIYIPLSDELGLDIFNKLRDNEIDSNNDFLDYFKGITIIPDTLVNSHVLGFKFLSSSGSSASNSSMRLYYTNKSDNDNEDYDSLIEFYVSSTTKQFNRITSTLDNTNLNTLNNDEATISSIETDHKIYAQGGNGISARIEFTSLKNLNLIPDDTTILDAELTFKPDNTYEFKDSLEVYIVDHKNRLLSLLTDINSNQAYAVLKNKDDEFNQNSYYSVDATGFVENILNATYEDDYALVIQFIDYNKTVDKVAIKHTTEDDSEIQLSVKYLKY